MEEIWKDIEGYEGLYQISNMQRVKSLKRNRLGIKHVPTIVNERIMKLALKNGYKAVTLNKNATKKRVLIHRLMAIAFIPNPENKPTVNHKNGIRDDSRLENLEWATYSENMYHAIHTLNKKYPPSQKGKTGALSKCSKKVDQFSKSNVYIKTFASARDAGRETGVAFQNIYHCIKGTIPSAGGYKWRFSNPK